MSCGILKSPRLELVKQWDTVLPCRPPPGPKCDLATLTLKGGAEPNLARLITDSEKLSICRRANSDSVPVVDDRLLEQASRIAGKDDCDLDAASLAATVAFVDTELLHLFMMASCDPS